MAIAYVIDYRHVRSRLQAVADLRRAMAETRDDRSASEAARDGASLRPGALWRRWRNSDRIDQLLRLPAFADCDAAQRETSAG